MMAQVCSQSRCRLARSTLKPACPSASLASGRGRLAWKPLPPAPGARSGGAAASCTRRLVLQASSRHQQQEQQQTASLQRSEEPAATLSLWSPPGWLAQLLRAAAMVALAAAVSLTTVSPALAARSGGRIGGSSFGRPSYGSSYGSSSSSYGSRSTFGSSYSALGGSLSNRAVGPAVTSSFFFPTPWFGGYGGFGMGYPMGGGFGSLIFWGVFAVIAIQVGAAALFSCCGCCFWATALPWSCVPRR